MEQDNDNIKNNGQVEPENASQPTDIARQSSGDQSPDAAPSSHFSFYAALIIIVLVLTGAAWWMFGQKESGTNEQSQTETSYPEVVATVNGVEVMREAFLRNITQTEQLAVAQGASLEDMIVRQQVEEQALASTINTELLSQAAVNAGVKVTDEQVNEQVSALETQYGDAAGLAAEMEKFDLTETELRSNIRAQLLVENFVTSTEEYQSISVDDSEIEELYNSLAAQGQELPPLEEVAEQIRQSLLAQKQQQVVSTLLESLWAEATIETHI